VRRGGRRGFTLLEALVATTIMGLAVGTLLAALSTSMRNAGKLTDNDRAAILAQRTMDELLSAPQLPMGSELQGNFDPRVTGLQGGWRARVEPFERVEPAEVQRVVLEVWWMQGSQRRAFQVETYRHIERGPR